MAEYQRKIAEFILDCEARRDSKGRLAVYPLPRGDGGGTFEVAGINDRYDHDEAFQLRDLIEAGSYDEAEQFALDYYLRNTDQVAGWTIVPAIEAFLRDSAFNRGVRGCAKIMQRALDLKVVDGAIGPITRAQASRAEADPAAYLKKLRQAREDYELAIAPPVGARAKFCKGLVNRWNKALAFSQSLLPA